MWFSHSSVLFDWRNVQKCVTQIIYLRPLPKVRHEILERKPSIHLFAFNMDWTPIYNWSWNTWTLHNFCSMLVEQLNNLEKARTDNLTRKFRTDLWDQVMDDWSVRHSRWLAWDECLQKQVAKKILKSKIEAHPFNAGHYTAFKHCISFATNLAANFGCYWFRITPDVVSKLLCAANWSCCAVPFKCEQTPFLWTVRWFRPAAMQRIEFRTRGFVPMSYFYSETNDWEKDWAKLWAQFWLGQVKNIFAPIPSKFSPHMKTENDL